MTTTEPTHITTTQAMKTWLRIHAPKELTIFLIGSIAGLFLVQQLTRQADMELSTAATITTSLYVFITVILIRLIVKLASTSVTNLGWGISILAVPAALVPLAALLSWAPANCPGAAYADAPRCNASEAASWGLSSGLLVMLFLILAGGVAATIHFIRTIRRHA